MHGRFEKNIVLLSTTTDLFPDGENHPLSDTLRFTLSIGWGTTTQTYGKGFPRGI